MASRSTNFELRSKSKDEYNKHRHIQLLNLPPSTEGELHEFLNGFEAKKIKISETLDTALVTLENGNQVDDAVAKLNGKEFKDNTVTVKLGYSNQLICIAHIPCSYTDAQFLNMCQKYGAVEYSYIMRSEETGDSKGYGFVEFAADIEQAKLIKSEFDWKVIEGQTLHADFVEESCQTWERLQSRCLLITNMAEDFVDVSRLREMFGAVTSPVYCQIIAKGDRSLGYGIVEFRTAEDAEKTWLKLRDEKIQDRPLVMTFCIPGKSAVVINNRIMWKYGDKLTKSSSLLPDPVSAKPVIAGNPIVMSLTKFNPSLMGEFTKILGELQQAYVSQMMSPVNKPGLLGPAPSLPLSPMMNPNMQLGLLVMLAIHIQAAKRMQFTGVLAKQLNTLSEQDVFGDIKGPKPSILGDPLTGQANVILTSLKQQLNQVPLIGEDGKEMLEPLALDEKLRYITKKFIANGRYLNLSLLNNLGQLLVTMKQGDVSNRFAGKGQSLLGPMPAINPQPLLSGHLGGKGNSLLGDAPQPLMGANVGAANVNASIMQAMGLNVGSGSSTGSVGQSLLSQISQGLVHQIGQNLLYQMSVGQGGNTNSGKGLLGDIPSDGHSRFKGSGQKSSLLGEPPAHVKSTSLSSSHTSVDQGSWKNMETRKKTEMSYENVNQMDRWGTGAYESGYSNKMGGYTDYSYSNESYGMNAGYAGGMGAVGYGMGQNNNQATGVNFQDGQLLSKENSSGLGQDKYGTDNYVTGMGAGVYGLKDSYGNYDAYGSVSGMYGNQDDSSSMGGNSLLGNGPALNGGMLGRGAGLLGSGAGTVNNSGMYNNYVGNMSTDTMGSYNQSSTKMGLLGSGSYDGNTYSGIGSGSKMGTATFTGLSGSTGTGTGLLPSPSKFMTPGQKRSHSQLLPPPEQSPDGTDYIGQHSQGLGGHYMDSYKRSRLF
ncbi:ribonucleoprotein PTB-binding 1-like isoform X2 [Physella acuta]|uniref:ribonucleoprotein PTB-binding 1-like isoform X2 n=1 Tax=Physella acuta TaxID=109671 RepID=UPI0027DE582E|nr:ribonucleoprotein PTB-binding 1-like isoform X2 [Physella acuta]